MHNKPTLTYFKTSLAASQTKECHISAIVVCIWLCAYMQKRLLMRLDENLSLIIFVKLCREKDSDI